MWANAKWRVKTVAAKSVIDVKNHILVPKFELLTEEQTHEVLEKIDISILQLPTILVKDPMAKSIGAEVGQVIKIERKGPTGKIYYYYRRVIE